MLHLKMSCRISTSPSKNEAPWHETSRTGVPGRSWECAASPALIFSYGTTDRTHGETLAKCLWEGNLPIQHPRVVFQCFSILASIPLCFWASPRRRSSSWKINLSVVQSNTWMVKSVPRIWQTQASLTKGHTKRPSMASMSMAFAKPKSFCFLYNLQHLGSIASVCLHGRGAQKVSW